MLKDASSAGTRVGLLGMANGAGKNRPRKVFNLIAQGSGSGRTNPNRYTAPAQFPAILYLSASVGHLFQFPKAKGNGSYPSDAIKLRRHKTKATPKDGLCQFSNLGRATSRTRKAHPQSVLLAAARSRSAAARFRATTWLGLGAAYRAALAAGGYFGTNPANLTISRFLAQTQPRATAAIGNTFQTKTGNRLAAGNSLERNLFHGAAFGNRRTIASAVVCGNSRRCKQCNNQCQRQCVSKHSHSPKNGTNTC